jgi:hypothetical protein
VLAGAANAPLADTDANAPPVGGDVPSAGAGPCAKHHCRTNAWYTESGSKISSGAPPPPVSFAASVASFATSGIGAAASVYARPPIGGRAGIEVGPFAFPAAVCCPLAVVGPFACPRPLTVGPFPFPCPLTDALCPLPCRRTTGSSGGNTLCAFLVVVPFSFLPDPLRASGIDSRLDERDEGGEGAGEPRGDALGEPRGEGLGDARGEGLGEPRRDGLGEPRGEWLGEGPGETRGDKLGDASGDDVLGAWA